MNKLQRNIWFFVAAICAVCLTRYALWHIVSEPWHVLPGLGGDGAKNDFTYLYQSIYGKGFWFNGMNYPYGDNIVFADGQATLSVFLNQFRGVTVGEALAVVWSLVGLSYVLSILFIYQILIHFRVAPAFAVVFACLVGIFSPQVFRISGHYGLSYICVVPMLFYWTLKYHERPHWKYAVYIFILGVFMTFLHPYFSAIVLVWVMFYVLGYIILYRQTLVDKLKHTAPLLTAVIGVFVVFGGVMKMTDPVTDRPTAPYGILVYVTRESDIFTSDRSPIWQYVYAHPRLQQALPAIRDTGGGEGYTYPGLVVMAIVLFSFLMGIIYKLRKKDENIIVSKGRFELVWLFMAFGALLFSMGAPYIWHMEWLLNYMSFMRQFRSLGRFSWIFYYIIAIYAVVVLYDLFSRLTVRRHFIVAYTMLFMALGVWGFEASGYVKALRKIAASAPYNCDMFLSNNEQNWDSFLKEHKYDRNDFQAVLVLAFFHVGSDKLWVGDPGWKMTLGCKASFQLQLPMVDEYMSRTSWLQTNKQVKIAAGPYVTKPMFGDIKSNKPFLLLKYDHDSLDQDQRYLLQAADHIGHFSMCEVYAFYPDRQIANDKKNADTINSILPFVKSGDTCIGDKGEWYVNHLDGIHASEQFFGTGAAPMIREKDSNVAVIPIRPVRDSQVYEFSCWFLLSRNTYASPCVDLESLDSLGNIIQTDNINTKWSVDNYNLWYRSSIYFALRSGCRAVRCKLFNDPNPSYEVMDEILLRPADALIISKDADGRVLVNNHLFRKGK